LAPVPHAEQFDLASIRPVLVTGASGHIGANLVRALTLRGRRVRALVRREAPTHLDETVEIAVGDVCDPTSLGRACAGVETVFHLAGKIDTGNERPDEVRRINVNGTANVAAACRKAGVRRLVHFSSIQALRTLEGLGEVSCASTLVAPHDSTRSIYDRTKAEAERVVLASCTEEMSVVILNPTAVIGPCDFRRSAMGRVLLALAQGRIFALVAGAMCDFVDVRDVVEAALAAEALGRSSTRYLVSGTRLNFVEFAHRWSLVTGRSAPSIVVPFALANLAAPVSAGLARLVGKQPLFTPEALRILRTLPKVHLHRTTEDLGYCPRPIDETLHDTWLWMKAAGWS
jgi:dihydroflavonol-4-reductase